MANMTVRKALPDREEVKPVVRGKVKRALADRETVKPKKSRGKVRAALGRKSGR
jgi:hypothetical protein